MVPTHSVLALALLAVATCCLPEYVFTDDTPPEPVRSEPPFPELLRYYAGDTKVKIVSESFDENGNHKIIEEYLDMTRRISAYVTIDDKGREVSYSSGAEDLLLTYKPYNCKVDHMRDSGIKGPDIDSWCWSSADKFYVRGIAGIWLHLAAANKEFSTSRVFFSPSKEIYMQSDSWSSDSADSKYTILMLFTKASQNSQTKDNLVLESVQVLEKGSRKKLRVFNVKSVEYNLSEEEQSRYLTAPLGYGCYTQDSPAFMPRDFKDDLLMNIWKETAQTELEISATKFATDKDSKEQTDTVTVELIDANDVFSARALSLRIRNTARDVKYLYDFNYFVRFTMDLRQGYCTIDHVDRRPFGNDWSAYDIEKLKFNNGLELNLAKVWTKLTSHEGSKFVKATPAKEDRPEIHYYESDVEFESRPGRVVRSYVLQDSILKPRSITLLSFNNAKSQIVEMYQFNVIFSKILRTLEDLSKLLDVSELCYLNNEEMKYGRDYNWIELTYPATSRQLDILSVHETQIKRFIYTSYLAAAAGMLRAPRVEVMFEDDSFTMRILLLDIPPLDKIYDKYPKKHIALIDQAVGLKIEKMSHLSPDLGHCVEYCRLNYCKMMTYCAVTSNCEIVSYNVADVTKLEMNKILEPLDNCDTYAIPMDGDYTTLNRMQQIIGGSLHAIIARLQHQDYDVTTFPKPPEELILPTSETGLTEDLYELARSSYMKTLSEFLGQKYSKDLPSLTFMARVSGVLMILVPNKFEVEHDPMSDFGLVDQEDYQEQVNRIKDFRQGLALTKIKVIPAVLQSVLDEKTDDGLDIRQLPGLNYDQCAMACLDSKCGTFSYCHTSQDCVLSSASTVGGLQGHTEFNQDCFIAQRDFLNNFVLIGGVETPEEATEMAEATDASDCALECVGQTSYKCLAFDFCRSSDSTKKAKCFYHKDRSVGRVSGSLQKTESQNSCDHYSRSTLADFTRLQYRRVEQTELDKLKTSIVSGESIYKCAETCAEHLSDCTAFQFCLDLLSLKAHQECTFIQSKPDASSRQGFKAVVDERNNGRAKQVGDYFIHDINCQVFALRKDSVEAHLRDLAFDSLVTVEEQQEEVEKEAARKVHSGWSFHKAFLLFTLMGILSAAISSLVCLVRSNHPYVMEKTERFRILIGQHFRR